MESDDPCFARGQCDCGFVRYAMRVSPLIVHCCHCSWCQRESGASFALNAMIESAQLQLLQGSLDYIDTPSASGKGQRIARCPTCRVAVWSHYAGAGELISFIRVGTLEHPNLCPPDIHIFTEAKQSWLTIPDSAKQVQAYYKREDIWTQDSLQRYQNLLPHIERYRRAL